MSKNTAKQEPVETVEDIASKTLTGDIRDWLLGRVRTLQKPWAQMNESEQREQIQGAEKAASELVRQAVNIIAARDFGHVFVSVGQFTVKDGEAKVQITCPASTRNLTAVNDSMRAVLVFAEPEVFTGERAKAKPQKDQPDLIEDEAA